MRPDHETGCTEEEMNGAEWQALWEAEAYWREYHERMEQLKEMEKARGE